VRRLCPSYPRLEASTWFSHAPGPHGVPISLKKGIIA